MERGYHEFTKTETYKYTTNFPIDKALSDNKECLPKGAVVLNCRTHKAIIEYLMMKYFKYFVGRHHERGHEQFHVNLERIARVAFPDMKDLILDKMVEWLVNIKQHKASSKFTKNHMTERTGNFFSER